MTNPLQDLRRQIDALDDELLQLLAKRGALAGKIGALKAETAPGACPIRPGREAMQLRRLTANAGALPPAGIAALWRTIISLSTAMEQKLRIAAYAPDADQARYWMAREYFGPFTPVSKHPQVKRVIGELLDGRAQIGILPMPLGSDADPWWTALIEPGKDMPRIFACLPFTADKNSPTALAIAKLTPEQSGDDTTLLALTVNHDLSQHKLQTSLTQSGLQAQWISATPSGPDIRLHLIALKGFFTKEDAALAKLQSQLGESLMATHILGAYANPLEFP